MSRRLVALVLALSIAALVTTASSCSSGGARAAAAEGPARVDSRSTHGAAHRTAHAPAPRAVVWIGGDVLADPRLRESAVAWGDAPAGLAHMIAPIADRWREDADDAVVLLNMESPVAWTRYGSDHFLDLPSEHARVRAPLNAPAWVLEGLAAAGVDAVVLANNHTLDQTREGLGETLDAVDAAGLVAVGAGRAPDIRGPLVVGPPGARTAVLAFVERDYAEPEGLTPGEPGVSVLDSGAIALVRDAARANDAVIVTVHVVAELRDWVSSTWRTWADGLIDAGADAIIVHGTHVVGPVERVRRNGRDVIVAWSLGNFMSDMGRSATPHRTEPDDASKWQQARTREGLVARVEVRAAPGGARVVVRFVPIWLSSDRYLVERRILAKPYHFSLITPSRCATPELPETWPEPERAAARAWIRSRLEHILSISKLEPRPCDEAPWLELPSADETEAPR